MRTVDVEGEGQIEQTRARLARELAGREFLTTLVAAVAFLGVAVTLALEIPSHGAGGGNATVVAVLLVACFALADRVPFEVEFGFAVPTQIVFVPLVLLAPLGLVPLLVALGYLVSKLPEHARGQWHPERMALHLVSAWFSIGPVLVLAAAGEREPSLKRWPILLAALAAQFAADFASSAAIGHFAHRVTPHSIARAVKPIWLVDLALTPLGLVLAYASLTQRYAFLLGVPLLGLLAYFARERKTRIDHALELSHAYRGTALLLGDMVEADDAYTGLHSQDVVSLVLAVADRLGLDPAERRSAEFTALLHDVGKVKIPNEIINKPGPLDPEERAIINTHTIEGQLMLEKVGGLLGEVGHVVRSCHERWDGAGYPDRLAGAEIPLVARIVCACDAFSAMTTDRSYRKAMTRDEAVAELLRCSGTHFDPRVVEALVAVADLQRPLAPAPAVAA